MSNMYAFIDVTRNFLGGVCQHKCKYCYINSMKEKFPNIRERYSGEIRLLEKELNKGEGTGNIVFVQDMGDLFANNVPSEFILKILEHLKKYPDNTYLFQTKNPKRYLEFEDDFPSNVVLGVTIETNDEGKIKKISKAPSIKDRQDYMQRVKFAKTFVTIEPIISFNLEEFVRIIRDINPDFVNIGADSKNNGLNEPSWDEVESLIRELKKFTGVKVKPNLLRLKEKL